MVAEKEHSGQHASLILPDTSCLFGDDERQLACTLVSGVYIPSDLPWVLPWALPWALPWTQVADNWVCNFGLHLPLQASLVTDTPGDDDQLTSVDQGHAYL